MIKQYLDELAVAKGCTLFTGKVQCYVAIKLDGTTCMAYTFNEAGVKIWARSKLCEDIVTNYELTNHTFDARIQLQEDTPETRKLVEDILDVSIKYQQEFLKLKSLIANFKR